MVEDRLSKAVCTLRALDRATLSPVAYGDAREKALVDGLHGLAARFNLSIAYTRIDGNGEMAFNLAHGGHYGAGLAALLSQVPRRTGTWPTTAAVLPENNWCWINHFDVERLLQLVHDQTA